MEILVLKIHYLLQNGLREQTFKNVGNAIEFLLDSSTNTECGSNFNKVGRVTKLNFVRCFKLRKT